MWTLQIALLAVSAGFGCIEAFGQLGKCNTEHIVAAHVPLPEVEKHLKWRVVYSTDDKHVGDHEGFSMKQILGGGNYKAYNRKVYKDKSETRNDFDAKLVDNIMIADFLDKSGKRHRVYHYPLAITGSLAALLYRCSDNGNPNVDQRFIVIPEDVVPSDTEIQQLLAVDEALFPDSSRGTLVKLPEKIKD